ncbi:hypothetical protein SDC9_193830 [bioreactor metagenome]|uniref:Uncharacterized protein n=1 Tax=bioreactor metagenome TaxID=1076179 RepID=A0A645I4M3_9ZZZZ
MLPMATVVAVLEPLIAAKKAQAKTSIIASPPDILAMKTEARSTSFAAMPPSLIAFPAKIYSGMAISGNDSIAPNADCPIMLSPIVGRSIIPAIDERPSPMPIGIRITVKIAKRANISMAI